ncbi:MAG: hypothetical protein WCL32_19245, partial [Planctomycetota bacterium]
KFSADRIASTTTSNVRPKFETSIPTKMSSTPTAATVPPVANTTSGNGRQPLNLNDPAVAARMRRESAILGNAVFPISILHALRLDGDITLTAARIFLAQFRHDAGEPADAIEKLLVDQLALAHLRVGQLHADVEATSQVEFKKLYLVAAVRLLGEISKTVNSLIAYRASIRGNDPKQSPPPPPVQQPVVRNNCSTKKKIERRKGK